MGDAWLKFLAICQPAAGSPANQNCSTMWLFKNKRSRPVRLCVDEAVESEDNLHDMWVALISNAKQQRAGRSDLTQFECTLDLWNELLSEGLKGTQLKMLKMVWSQTDTGDADGVSFNLERMHELAPNIKHEHTVALTQQEDLFAGVITCSELVSCAWEQPGQPGLNQGCFKLTARFVCLYVLMQIIHKILTTLTENQNFNPKWEDMMANFMFQTAADEVKTGFSLPKTTKEMIDDINQKNDDITRMVAQHKSLTPVLNGVITGAVTVTPVVKLKDRTDTRLPDDVPIFVQHSGTGDMLRNVDTLSIVPAGAYGIINRGTTIGPDWKDGNFQRLFNITNAHHMAITEFFSNGETEWTFDLVIAMARGDITFVQTSS